MPPLVAGAKKRCLQCGWEEGGEEGARLQTHLEKRNKVSILEPANTTKRVNPLLLLIVPLVLAATWATKTRRDDAREKREEEGKENFTRFPSCPKFLLANK